MSHSYRQIFKSTVLVAGSQVIGIAIGIVRTKVLAVLLGTSGVGIAGMYQAIIDMVGAVAGMGIQRSGVRQIAESGATHDHLRVARTSVVLRRLTLGCGLLGTLFVLIFCGPLSRFSFASSHYAGGVAVVALTLLFTNIYSGQIALLQGLRRLKEMATCQILGAFAGAVISVFFVWWLRERGIVLFIVGSAAFTVLTSWWFTRRLGLPRVSVSLRETLAESRGFLSMGVAFMVSGMASMGVVYVTRVLVIHELGPTAVGLYTATVTLSSIYVGIVLSAMQADYYPRLVSVANDHPTLNRLVNEQTELGLLIAIPGVLLTLVLAPLALSIFYTDEFRPAAEIIRWQILGVALRVVSWPMGTVLPAKGLPKLLMATELLFGVVAVGLVFVGMRIWGMNGLGIAFFLLYALYSSYMLVVTRHITGFLWSRGAGVVVAASTLAAALVFGVVHTLPPVVATVVGLSLTAAVSGLCFWRAQALLGISLKQLLWARLSGVKRMAPVPSEADTST